MFRDSLHDTADAGAEAKHARHASTPAPATTLKTPGLDF